MSEKNITDPQILSDIQEHAKTMKDNLATRNTAFDEYE
jgi:hypothetical protein